MQIVEYLTKKATTDFCAAACAAHRVTSEFGFGLDIHKPLGEIKLGLHRRQLAKACDEGFVDSLFQYPS